MDIPFKSISVRDLLPSHDLDDSSPLSAPDLCLIIDHLQVRSLQIKSKVQNYIVSHHSDFSALFSQCSAAFSGAEHLSGEVSDLIRLVSESPIDVEIKEVVDEVSEMRREVREKRKVLELVSVIVEVSEKLKFVREMMRGGRVVEAAEGIRGLEEALRIREGEVKEEDGEPVVYGLSRSEWMDCFQEVVGVMDFGLAKVADLIIKYVITQAVNPESHISFSEEMIQDSGRKTEVVLKMVPSFEPKVVPDSKLADFQSIIQLTTQFETDLKDLMFISASDNKDERLSDFAENVEVHFASRKKVEILAKARSLLLQSNFVLPNGVTRDAKVLKNE